MSCRGRAADDSWQGVIRLLAGQLGRDNPEHAGKVIAALVSPPNESGNADNHLALACECMAELDSKQLGLLQTEIAALVDGLYLWLARRHELGLWRKLDRRIASALRNIHVSPSVRASLNLRALPKRKTRIIDVLSTPAIVRAFWNCDERTRGYLMAQARSAKDCRTSVDAIATLAAHFRDHPETMSFLHECALEARDEPARARALAALAELFAADPDTLPFLRTRAVDDPDSEVRKTSLELLPEEIREEVKVHRKKRRARESERGKGTH